MSRQMGTNIESYAVTDTGYVRKNNEDALLMIPAAGCFLVSDGIGGGAVGEVASAMMVKETEKVFLNIAPNATPGEREEILIRAIYRVNFNIKDYAENHGYDKMGATVVAMLLDPWHSEVASIFHAGDSRAYRIRDKQIEQLTEDHTYANSINLPEEKISPRFRNVLTNALGCGSGFYLDHTSVPVQKDDLFLICSDGLTKMVEDEDILHIICRLSSEPTKVITNALLRAALERGGRDNISIILIRVKEMLPPYDPNEEESEREFKAQLRNATKSDDTQPTEMDIPV